MPAENDSRPRLTLIANPKAGANALDSAATAVRVSAPQRKILASIIKDLRGDGYNVSVHHEVMPAAVEQHAYAAAESGADVVVAAGGDGTINATINGLMRWREENPDSTLPALGVVPLGTGNVLAFNLGLPRDWQDASKILCGGHTRTIDVGLAIASSQQARRYFVLMAGIGYDAQVIEATSLRMKYVLRDFAYVLKTLENVVRHQGTQLTLHLGDGKIYANIGWLVMVGNAASYAWNVKVTPHAELDDGLLDVCLMPYENNLFSVQQALQVLTGQHVERGIAEYWQVPGLRVESSPNVPIQLDGDEWSTTPVELSIVPGALRVLVPQT